MEINPAGTSFMPEVQTVRLAIAAKGQGDEVSDEIKIDKGVPLPSIRTKSGIQSILKVLKVGDSFVFELSNPSNAHSNAKNCGIKIAVRKQPDGQYRIWRIA